MDDKQKEKLNKLIENAIERAKEFSCHYDKYDNEGRKMWEAELQSRRELDRFISEL
ncbi:hypothetical protein POP12_248 [Pectobacterium phage POP12]|nr:hypothetical protein POP12_248 [Pectobacterium phage POP12]